MNTNMYNAQMLQAVQRNALSETEKHIQANGRAGTNTQYSNVGGQVLMCKLLYVFTHMQLFFAQLFHQVWLVAPTGCVCWLWNDRL